MPNIFTSGGTSVANGTITYTSTSLPNGLTLTSAGDLIGSPTVTVSNQSVTVTAHDSYGATAQQTTSVTVNADSVTTQPTLSVSSLALTVGTPYSSTNIISTQAVFASGLSPSYAATNLPSGMTLSTSGFLSGNPTSASYVGPISVYAYDTYATSSFISLPCTVTSGADTVTFTTVSLSFTVGTSVAGTSIIATSSQGKTPITYAVTSGNLPNGITLNSSGALTGTPTVGGGYSFVVTATDSINTTATQTFSGTVMTTFTYDSNWTNVSLLLNGENAVNNSSNFVFTDVSSSALTITPNGTITVGSFNPLGNNWSVYFNGSSYITSVIPALGSGNFTVEAWIYPTSYSGTPMFISTAASGQLFDIQLMLNTSGNILFQGHQGTQYYITSTSTAPLNNWTHVALVRNGTTKTLYVNGVNNGNSLDSINYSSTSFTLGAYTSSGTQIFSGYISNVRLNNTTAIYTGNFTPPISSLTALSGTVLLTCQSNRIVDNSSSPLTLTVAAGTSTVQAFSPFVTSTPYSSGLPVLTNTATPTSWSYYFNGSTNYVSGPTGSATQFAGNFTVEAWVYPTLINTYNTILTCQSTSDATGFAFGYSSGGIYLSLAAAPTTFYGGPINPGYWYHFALVRSGTTITAYVNGIASGTITNSTSFTDGYLRIGAEYNATSFVGGYISNLRVNNTTAVYTTNFVPSTTSLTAISGTSLLTCQSGGFTDNSANNLALANTGALSSQYNPFNNASYSVSFNGSTQYVTGPTGAAAQFSGNFTFETWVNYTSFATNGMIFDTRATTSSSTGIACYVATTGFLTLATASSVTATGNTVLAVNTWNHIAVVRNSGVITMYVNGVPQTATWSTATNFSDGRIAIGAGVIAGNQFFQGYMSNFRINNTNALYTAQFIPPTGPLTSTATLYPSSIQNFDGNFIDTANPNGTWTLHGNAKLQSNVVKFGIGALGGGQANNALGSGDYLTSPFTYGGRSTPWALRGWFYFTTASRSNLFSVSNSLQVFCTGTLIEQSSSFGNVTGTTPISTNTWYYIETSFDGSNLRVYVNGVLDSTTTGTTIAAGTGTVLVATDNGSADFMNGYIDGLEFLTWAPHTGTASYTVPSSPPSMADTTTLTGTTLLTFQSGTIVDNSTNNLTLTNTGNALPTINNPFTSSITSTSQNYGWSNYFDGSTGYIITPTNSLNLASNAFTVEAWIYPTSLATGTGGNYNAILYGSNNDYAIGVSALGVMIVQNNTTVTIQSGTGTVPLNSWTHFAITSTTAGAITVYINGVSRTTGTITGITNSTKWIGNNPSNTSQYFAGYISNLRVVIGNTIYTTPFTPSLSSLSQINSTRYLTALLTCQTDGFIDNGVNNLTLTKSGTVAVTEFSPFNGTNNSVYFNGTSAYLSGPTSAATKFSSNFTVESWVYPTSFSTSAFIFGFSGSASNTTGFLIGFSSTGAVQLYTGGSYVLTTTSVLTLNTWTHLAIVRSSGIVTIYANGTNIGVITNTSNFSDGVLYIGRNSTNASNYYLGYISNLRINNTTAVYTSNFTPSTSALSVISGTSLLTCQGNTFTDNSGNNLALTANGNPIIQEFSPFSNTGLISTSTNSMWFDGSTGYLQGASGPATQFTGNFTVEFWVYPVSFAVQQIIFDTRTSSSSTTGISIGINTNGTVLFNTNNTTYTSTSTILVNNWTHLALVRNNGIITLYANGVVAVSQASLTASLVDGKCLIGKFVGGTANNFNGYISNIRINNGLALYLAPFNPQTTSLTANASLNPVSIMNFDGSLVDSASSNITWTSTNASVSSTIYKFGSSSLAVLGTASYISTTNIPSFGSSGWSVRCWVYLNSIAASGNTPTIYILGNTTSTSSAAIGYVNNSGTVKFVNAISSTGSSWNIVPSTTVGITTPVIGSWYYLEQTYDNITGYYRFYVNGNQEIAVASTTPIFSGSTVTLGNAVPNPVAANQFNGYIDGFEILPYCAHPYGNYSGLFNGSSQSITGPTGTATQFAGNFTIEAWFYLNASTGWKTIFDTRASNASTTGVSISFSASGSLTPTFTNGTTTFITSNLNVLTNQWYHIAAVRSGTTLTLYINGTSVGNSTSALNFSDGLLKIGNDINNNYFPGYISNVRVNNTTAVYTSNFTPTYGPLSPITGTSLLTLQNSVLVDNSANGLTLTNNGTVTFPIFAPAYSVPTSAPSTSADAITVNGTSLLVNGSNTGVIDQTGRNDFVTVGGCYTTTNFSKYGNGSLFFDGSTGYCYTPSSNNSTIFTGNFTVEMWTFPTINHTSTTSLVLWSNLIETGSVGTNTSSTTGLLIGQYNNNFVVVANTAILITSSIALTLNTWNHIALVRSSGVLTLYINGVSTGTYSTTISYTDGLCYLGSWAGNGGNQYYAGYIDDFRVTNGVARYTTNFTPPTSALASVGDAFSITWVSSVTLTVGQSYVGSIVSSTSSISGLGITYTASGLPAGMTLSGAGVLSGTPTSYASNNFFTAIASDTITSVSALIPLNINADTNWANVSMLLNGENTSNNSNNSAFTDLSSSALTLTPTGTIAQGSFNPFGSNWSTYFDGSSSYLSIPGASFTAPGTNNFTIEAWINSTSTTNNQQIIGQYATPSNGSWSFKAALNPTSAQYLDFTYYNNGYVDNYTTTPIANTGWNHVAVTRNGTSLVLYLNGVSIKTVTLPSNFNFTGNSSNATIGYEGVDGTYYTGYISNLRYVVGSVVYTSNFTPPTSPLTAISGTALLTCQSNRIVDNSSNNTVITITGTPATKTLSPFIPTASYVSGLPTYTSYTSPTSWSYLFSGSQYLSASTTVCNFAGNFTIEAWIFPLSFASQGTIFTTATSTDQQGFYIGITTSGLISYLAGNGTWIFNSTSASAIPLNTWTHIAYVKNGSTYTIYINGISSGTSTTATALTYSNNAINIGGRTIGPQYFNGYISNVRANSTAVYTSNFIPQTTPLTAISGTQILTCQSGVVQDLSSNNVQLANNGNTIVSQYNPFGNSTYSGYFNGSNTYITLPTLFNNSTSNFTIECWVYLTSLPSAYGLFTQRTVNTNYSPIELNYSSSALTLYASTSGSSWAIGNNSSQIIQANEWTHVAVVRNGSTFSLFLNGVQTVTATASGALMASTAPFVIGADASAGTNVFPGYISNFRVVGSALYIAPFTPPTGPVTTTPTLIPSSILNFDSYTTSTNSTLVDNASKNITWTFVGSAKLQNSVVKFGNAALGGGGTNNALNGSTDYIYSTSNRNLSGAWSIRFWFNASTLGTNVIMQLGNSSFYGVAVSISSSKLSYYLSSNGTSWNLASAATGATTLTTNSWNYFEITYDTTSNSYRAYLNGVQDYSLSSTSTITTGIINLSVGSNGIAGAAGSQYFNGYIDGFELLPYCVHPNGTSYSVPTSAPSISDTATASGSGTSLLTLQNTPTGLSSYAGVFNGTTSYITNTNAAPNASFQFIGNFTIETWINVVALPTSGNVEIIFDSRASGSSTTGFALYLYNNSGTQEICASVGQTTVIAAIQTLTATTWYHLAVVRSGSVMTMYLNGTSVGSANNSTSLTDGLCYIGRVSYSPVYYFNGYISNLRINNTTAVYTTNFVPSTSSLTAITGTSLLTLQGSQLVDNSGNNLPLVNNFVTFQPIFTGTLADLSGFSSYYGAYNGSTTYISGITSNPATQFTGNFTIEFWYYPIVNGNCSLFDCRATQTSSGGFELAPSSSGFMAIYTSGATKMTATTAFTTGAWNHFACVRNSGTITFYVNGFACGTYADSNSLTDGGLYIGHSPYTGAGYPNGYLSNYRINNTTAVYTSNFTVPVGPLTAISGTSLLTLQSSTLVDNSGNNVALTNNNGVTFGQFTTTNPLTNNGNVTMTVTNPFVTTSSTGTIQNFGWSNYFATNGYLTTPASPTYVLNGAFTAECWIYPTIAQSGACIFGNNNTNFICQYTTGTGGWVRFYYTTPSYITTSAASSYIYLNTWTHIAITRNSFGVMTIYVNGVADPTTATSTVAVGNSASSMYIGANNGSNFFGGGYISNFRLINGYAAYTSNFTPSTSPLTLVNGITYQTVLLTCQGNGFVDNSVNNLPVTVNNVVTDTQFSPFSSYGSNSYSALFNGSTQYITGPTSSATQFSGNFTIETFIYPTSFANNPIIFDTRSTGTSATGFALQISTSGSIVVYTNNSAAITTSAISLNSWYHIALVRNSSTITVYVNGVSSGTISNSSNFSDGLLYIGRLAQTQTPEQYFFGYMSNLRVNNTTAVYTSNFTPSTSPLTAITGTSLLTCQSSSIIDNSYNKIALTSNGNISIQEFSPFTNTSLVSTNSGSIYFNGSTSYLQGNTGPATQFTGLFTIDFWMYSTVSGSSAVFGSSNGNTSTGIEIFVDTSLHTVDVNIPASTSWSTATSAAIVPNEWIHIAIVRTNMSTGSYTYYVNGNSVLTSTTAGTGSYTDGLCIIGRRSYNSSAFFTGYISNFRIVNGSSLYSSNFTPPTTPSLPVTNTTVLLGTTNAGIIDHSEQNNFVTVGGCYSTTNFSKYGKASLFFDGSTGYCYAPSPNNSTIFTGNFTIEMWIYPTTFASSPQIIDCRSTGTSTTGIDMNINTSGQMLFNVGATAQITSAALTLNTWTHIAAVRNNGVITLYVNGNNTSSTYSSSTAFTDGHLIIGTGFNINNFYSGYIDDFRITNGIARYTANFTPPIGQLPNI